MLVKTRLGQIAACRGSLKNMKRYLRLSFGQLSKTSPSILVFSHLLPFQLASLDGTAQVG